jgi:hypothetical protein
VSPVRYELGFYIPEDGILHSHRRENLNSYIDLRFRHKDVDRKVFGCLFHNAASVIMLTQMEYYG